MRGKGKSTVVAGVLKGITPAYAGKSGFRLLAARLNKDHPRVCGEKSRNLCLFSVGTGSPPRMRGKVQPRKDKRMFNGITPAYAGKRRGWSKWQISSRGSPPRMRGKVESYGNVVWLFGITPAYAGKSRHFIVNNKSDRDHPRVCGEKQNSFQFSHTILGSPPRMRGKVLCGGDTWFRCRITPAYAGKRPGLALLLPRAGDHPRVCGEKGLAGLRTHALAGSPPRMRGKEPSDVVLLQLYGITPAYAGKRKVWEGKPNE